MKTKENVALKSVREILSSRLALLINSGKTDYDTLSAFVNDASGEIVKRLGGLVASGRDVFVATPDNTGVKQV